MVDTDLFYFKILSEKLNYTNASKELFISQSALSKSISRLEKKLGFPLFVRNTREVELTAAGKVFYKDVIEILDTLQQSIDRARAIHRKHEAVVRIGGHYANPKIYAAFDAMRARLAADGEPLQIEPDLRHVGSIERKPDLNDPYEDAVNGINDINILYSSNKLKESTLITVPLFSEPIAFLMPKNSRWASQTSIDLRDIADGCLIRTTTYYTYYWSICDLLQSAGIEQPRTKMRVADSMRDLVQLRANDEVLVLPESVASLIPVAEANEIVRIPCSDQDARVDVLATYLPEKSSDQVEHCIQELVEVTKDW